MTDLELLTRIESHPMYYDELNSETRRSVVRLTTDGLLIRYGNDVQLTGRGRAHLAELRAGEPVSAWGKR